VPVDDVAALALAMSQLMADPQLRERLGEEATKVRQLYAHTLLMKKWETCIVPLPPREPSKPVSRVNPASR